MDQMRPGVVLIESRQHFDELVQANALCVVGFSANWCGPCQHMKHKIENIAQQHEHVAFCKVDIDEEAEIPVEYEITNIPTWVFLHHGKERGRFSGACSEAEFVEVMEKFFAPAAV